MEEKNIDLEALAEMKRQSKKMRKKLLLILGGICFAVVVLFGVIVWISSPNDSKKPTGNPIYSYQDEDFYEPYEGDILENEEYLGLDRNIYYVEGGMEVSIVEENFNEFGHGVRFLYQYLQTLIAGDVEAHNACFNNSGYHKDDFNPQMIYCAKITSLRGGNDSNGNYVFFKLEYMIHRNDGTYRRDVLSDASRPQRIKLRVGEDGKVLIEEIITISEVVSNPTV